MSEIISYLNSPHLVASFQKVFGVEPEFSDKEQQQQQLNHHTHHHTYNHHDVYPSHRSSNGTSSSALPRLNRMHSNGGSTNGTGNGKTKLTTSNSVVDPSNGTITLTETVTTTAATTTTTARLGPLKPDDQSSNVDTQPQAQQQNHKRTNSNSGVKKQLVNVTDHSNLIANTTIHSRFWYYLFHAGAAMGHEEFFSVFFPFWFWNVDGAIARKVALLWGIFMYIGQATKDVVCSPRPASPPVVKLEERCIAEYGFPSTHAMISAGLPFSLVYLSHARYNIDLTLSTVIASLFCCWVCCSRLYLGMHSLLDVIAGVLYSLAVLFITIPILEPVDTFMITSTYAPFVSLTVGFAMCYFYPSVKQWSTARGDTIIITGTVVGFSVGAYLNHGLGWLARPAQPPLYDIQFPNALGYLHVIVRTTLGILMFFACRFVLKRSLLRLICHLNGLDSRDPASKKLKCVELPYYYFSYFVLGINIAFMSPVLFRLLNIERDYTYTEL